MKPSFVSRFLAFTVAFYVGSLVSVFILTVVKTAVFFQHHFWSWLLEWIQGDVFPVALAELFRSPLMGLLFALLGIRWLNRSAAVRFGVACGAFSYAVAYFFSIVGSTGGAMAHAVANFNLIEYFLLGLPIGLVFMARFLDGRIIDVST
jgi:hypothetical protein